MEYCLIQITFGNKKEVKITQEKLLQERLVSSCQVLNCNSIWRWKKDIEKSKEYILLLKTKKYLVNKIYNIVKGIHSYECFEFLVFDISSPSTKYLNWIDEETENLDKK